MKIVNTGDLTSSWNPVGIHPVVATHNFILAVFKDNIYNSTNTIYSYCIGMNYFSSSMYSYIVDLYIKDNGDILIKKTFFKPRTVFKVCKDIDVRASICNFKNLSDRNKQRLIGVIPNWWNSLSYHEQVNLLQ